MPEEVLPWRPRKRLFSSRPHNKLSSFCLPMLPEHRVAESLNSLPAVRAVRELVGNQAAPVYLAGEAVRDLLLGLTPSSFDFVVPTIPAEFAGRLRTTCPDATIVRESAAGELVCKSATLGKRNCYGSDRVSLEQWVDEHCCFTINSMLFDLSGNRLLCFNHALDDMEKKVIRASRKRPMRSFGAHIGLLAVRLSL